MFDSQAKVEALQVELKTVLQSKALLEKELQEVISLTSAELEEYQEKVLELEDEVSGATCSAESSGFSEGVFNPGALLFIQLQESRGFKKRIRRLEDANKKLTLELEHEKGKLTGLGQSHNALREHANVLEAALAKREADLVQLNLQVRQLTPQEQVFTP